MTRIGVFGLGYVGAVSLAVGSFLLFAGVSPVLAVSPWLIGAVVLSSLLFFGFAMTVAMRGRRRASITGQEGMVGLAGEARTDLAPEGQAWVKGALWRARALNGPIAKGTRIRVRRVDGLLLLVRAEDDGRE
jgi:membrane-bound serine protease (ClpP class)